MARNRDEFGAPPVSLDGLLLTAYSLIPVADELSSSTSVSTAMTFASSFPHTQCTWQRPLVGNRYPVAQDNDARRLFSNLQMPLLIATSVALKGLLSTAAL